MSDEESNETRSRQGWGRGLAWIFVVLAVAYPLSVGPVVFWVENHNPSPSTMSLLESVYTPIIYAYKHSDAVAAFYDWYLQDVWGVN